MLGMFYLNWLEKTPTDFLNNIYTKTLAVYKKRRFLSSPVMRKLYLGNLGWVYRVARYQQEPDRAPEFKHELLIPMTIQ